MGRGGAYFLQLCRCSCIPGCANYVDVHVFRGVRLHTLCNYLSFNVFVGSNGVHTVYNPFGFGGCIFDFILNHERNH